ncbi:MAG: OmpA family protein [Pseudanabaenaceae cyanobacterium SKYGB_i_bin29]|nr:OmpA family protein [Pseudanabaenaceae cyanobacterium SKYG29]MDW8421944.1 OmpA family protein [Pseudanabaenaceae cyanobacterium SKYGB_i_bin29]
MPEPEPIGEVEQSLVNLHRFLLLSQQHPAPPPSQPLDEQEGIRLLQKILLGEFIDDLERLQSKVAVLEEHVLDPSVNNAIAELQAKVTDQSALEELRYQLAGLEQNQKNLPSEIQALKERVSRLEEELHEPEELIELLLPLLNDLIERKVAQAGEEFARATAPVLDEMIRCKIAQDKPSVGKAIAPVLPEAISYHVEEAPGEFAAAIAPEMNLAIREQVRANAPAMIDALYPIMGNTIAKYIAEVLRNINAKLERAMSPEGIWRKIRAKWQGISEAELILRESFGFQVQAVFLIQKASGLVIAEAKPKDIPPLDAEMVAGMLTAIQGFVQECIAQGAELDRITYGNSVIWLEGAGSAYLAAVIQGQPTPDYLERVKRVMRVLILDYGQTLTKFAGNPMTVPGAVRDLLESLIPTVETPPRSLRSLGILTGLILLGTVSVWGYWQWQSHQRAQEVSKVQTALSTEPRLTIYNLKVVLQRDRLHLTGRVPNTYLKDLAQELAQATQPRYSVVNEIIAVELPPDPRQTQAEIDRLTKLWQSRPGIQLTVTGNPDLLLLAGTAPDRDTITTIGRAFAQVPGVTKVVNNLQEPPPKIPVQIFFAPNVSTLEPEDSLKIEQVKAILDRYPHYRLTIIGQTDGSGPPEFNQKLALERARSVEKALIQQGVSPDRLQVVSAPPPNTVRWHDRSVVFELVNQ